MASPEPAPLVTAQELARQFERQGIRCTEDDTTPQLWCFYCTTYLTDKHAAAQAHENQQCEEKTNNREQGGAVSSTPPPPPSFQVVLRPAKDAILNHCSSRLHLLLYEHHTQEDLQQWCPVELHGYRMLLNHHCVYPARMFGEGRLLMDLTIAGGMLLGQDVCGGVKLWPQHRYAAAELVLPSTRSGVREVWVPPPPPPPGARDIEHVTPMKRARGAGTQLQLLHEISEVAMECPATRKGRAAKGEKAPWYSKKDYAQNLSFIPRYFDEEHGLRTRRVTKGSLTAVLETTNAAIAAEARLRERRLQDAKRHYRVDDADDEESATESDGTDLDDRLE